MKFHLAGWLVKAKRIDRVVQCFYCVENGSLEYSNPGQNKVFSSGLLTEPEPSI